VLPEARRDAAYSPRRFRQFWGDILHFQIAVLWMLYGHDGCARRELGIREHVRRAIDQSSRHAVFFHEREARLGLLYSDREVWRLALRIGFARSRDLLFTGRRVSAAEAFTFGLVERLSEADGLDAMLDELLQQFSACAPRALRNTKEQLLRFEREGAAGVGDDKAAEQALFEADGIEGIRAFLERRTPLFPP